MVSRHVNTCCRQNSRSKQMFTQTMAKKFCLNKTRESIVFNQKCLIHLSPKRHNPLVAIVLRQAAKFVAVLTGRVVRKWWRELPPNKRQLVIQWFARHKWKFGLLLLSSVLAFVAYYTSHLVDTPITGRKRFIAFTPKQLKEINDYEFEVQLETYKHKLLPSSHEMSKRVARVATQLLNANNDLPQIHDNEWSISVVDDLNIKNAFVMPSGQIFVFSGMLAICDNDQQLGVVLAHEMAHCVQCLHHLLYNN
ncbi:unnamed protein product [Medioppia subpectinata]|uniref:Metalloendopeptidase OMA1, mitochondrial n=1 Tax=Medioppia subpectinata TaxID=1979941 RepID=A0A7R9PW93_9ACAR|nr:unnamed protein product [Medioppia subpectinata]CAG2103075.1 unnamed protein product [Medioppia subpectinata]